MKLELEPDNSKALNSWMWANREDGLIAIKGAPPEGATYSDGDLIVNPVNIAWKNARTGEVFTLSYISEVTKS